MTPRRLSEWSRPDSVCLGGTDAENARRIRALSGEVLRLRAMLEHGRDSSVDHFRAAEAIHELERQASWHKYPCRCPACFYSLAATLANTKRLICDYEPDWFWKRSVRA